MNLYTQRGKADFSRSHSWEMAETNFTLKLKLKILKSISSHIRHTSITHLPKVDFAAFWFLEFFITSPEGIHTYSTHRAVIGNRRSLGQYAREANWSMSFKALITQKTNPSRSSH